MNIKLQRVIQILDCTKGHLSINGEFECYVLEDVHHDVKVFGKTRIPAGVYEIKLNVDGGMNQRSPYVSYPWHKGMLELKGVPDYSNVYIHIGNYAKDTNGCLLVGRSDVPNKAMIGGSVIAYAQIYKKIYKEIVKGEKVFIEILDEARA